MAEKHENTSRLDFPGLSGVSVELTWVTPAEAESYLELNTRNRRKNEKIVRSFKDAMLDGGWDFNGSGNTIAVSNRNVLLDGQKRLTAQVASGSTLPYIIVRGLDPSVFDTIDTGQARSLANFLQIEGTMDANNVAAAVRAIYYHANGSRGQSVFNHILPDGRRNIQMKAILKFHDSQRDAVADAVVVGDHLRKNFRPVSQATGAYAYWVLSAIDKDSADIFFEALATNSGKEFTVEGSPIAALRQRLNDIFTDAQKKHTRVRPFIMVAYIFKAWNLWREGKSSSFLTLSAGQKESGVLPNEIV